MRTTSIDFRGQSEDIRYRDYGYEPDTNAHDIDWEFVDKSLNESVTDEEAEAIYILS